MSAKLTEYIGYWVEIKCDNCFCTGEICAIDSNTIILINSSINGVIAFTKFLGINKTLIQDMEIISHPKEVASEISSSPNNSVLNVYTSSAQPPVIKRGGSSSAVHRNLLRSNDSQEKINKNRKSNLSEKIFRPRITSSGSISKDHYLYNPSQYDSYKFRNFSDVNFRTRKTSAGNVPKEPSWMNYTFEQNDDGDDFDFDSNLALFDKSAFFSNFPSKRNATESFSYDSSDSGGINLNFKPNNRFNKPRSISVGLESHDFLSHSEEETTNPYNNLQNRSNKKTETKDVFTELIRMGIIPTPVNDEFISAKCTLESPPFVDIFLKE